VRHRRDRLRAARPPVQAGPRQRHQRLIEAAAVPYLDGARQAVRDGYVSGGTRRNLAWVMPHTDPGSVAEEDLLPLADAQTSGGLLVAGEVPGSPVIGELIAPGHHRQLLH